MAEYDFHQLSPYDLELLTRDLLQAEWGCTVENFKVGKDSGIDLRYARTRGQTIVQCKHYVRTGIVGLLRELKKEAVKVRNLKPTRYVLVTSVPLSPSDKNAIVDIIGSNFLALGDVVGQEGLNNLLGKHSSIESKHFKLWLASRAVLDRVLHNAAVTRSEFKVRQVYQEARRYVQSGIYPQALEMLGEYGLVIVAGPPGVGKTTLANLLLYEHVEKGYQAILIQRDIGEAQNLFQDGIRQVFYFDDFMGATFLGDDTAANNDRVLLDFIAMIRATPTARLILTTREHIYSQAMGKSERLRNSDMDDFRVFLRMPAYSLSQKARILYNHLYFSDLPPSYQDELLRNNFYLQIINHKKFNPRLIEWLSSFRRVRNVPLERYTSFVSALLEDPSEIWRHAYEQEISDAARSLLLSLFSLGGKASFPLLEAAFGSAHAERAKRYGYHTRPEDFRLALREIVGAFIKPWGESGIEVVDPSVLDLLNAVVRESPNNAVDLIASATRFDQIERIWSFAKAEKGEAVVAALKRHSDQLVSQVGRRMLDQRRIDHGSGSTTYHGTTFERRLAIVIEMADRMPGGQFPTLIDPLFERLLEEWSVESAEIIDGVSIIRALDRTGVVNDVEKRRKLVRSALLEAIELGCRSDELREVIYALDISQDKDDAAAKSARTAFEEYTEQHFGDELSDCRSDAQFDGLVEDLQFFCRRLGVVVDRLIERVEEDRVEWHESDDEYADHMHDEWRENRREEEASVRSVSEMFGSLRGDRD